MWFKMVLKDRNGNPIEEGKFYTDGISYLYITKIRKLNGSETLEVVARSSLSYFEEPLSYPGLPLQIALESPLSEEEVKILAKRLKNAADFVRARIKESG